MILPNSGVAKKNWWLLCPASIVALIGVLASSSFKTKTRPLFLYELFPFYCVACEAWSTHRDRRPRCHTFGFRLITLEGTHTFFLTLQKGQASLNTGQVR